MFVAENKTCERLVKRNRRNQNRSTDAIPYSPALCAVAEAAWPPARAPSPGLADLLRTWEEVLHKTGLILALVFNSGLDL
jgi:hypothetical protein